MIRARIERGFASPVVLAECCFLAGVPRYGENILLNDKTYEVVSVTYHTVSESELRKPGRPDVTIVVDG